MDVTFECLVQWAQGGAPVMEEEVRGDEDRLNEWFDIMREWFDQ